MGNITVKVMEYERTEKMNLGREMVANATKDLTHDKSHTGAEHWNRLGALYDRVCSTHG